LQRREREGDVGVDVYDEIKRGSRLIVGVFDDARGAGGARFNLVRPVKVAPGVANRANGADRTGRIIRIISTPCTPAAKGSSKAGLERARRTQAASRLLPVLLVLPGAAASTGYPVGAE